MPKMKTHSGAKKRFRITANGKVRGRHSFTSHIAEKKSPKRKRRLGQPAVISKHDEKQVKILLGAKRRNPQRTASNPQRTASNPERTDAS